MADTRTRLPLPEPVDYQIRLAGGCWTHCAKHIHEAAIKSGAAETRALYSADQMISFRAADNAALRAEVERLREDAERYRWLRDGDLNADYPYPVMRVGGDGHDYAVWFEELDAAIDAALAARKGEA